MKNIRKLLWKLLGIDYHQILNKLDYTLLKNDPHTVQGTGTYNNGAKVWRWTEARLEIGNYCSIAFDVNFILDSGYHQGASITSYPFINNKNIGNYNYNIIQKEGITIGHDVWIGMGAFILPGISIGNGVTIAANSVVTQDIPDYTVVAGSPARIIKHKFSQEQVAALNNIAWWNWTKEEIEKRKLEFYQLTIDEFIQKYEN